MQSARAHMKLLAAYEQRDWPRVEIRAAEVLRSAPGDVPARFMLGMAHVARGNVDGGADVLSEVCELQPGNAEYLARYAEVLAMAARLGEARGVADQAIAHTTSDVEVLDLLAQVYSQCHAVESAAECLRRAVVLAPERAGLHYRFGRILEMLGQYDAAERELEQCIQLDSKYWLAHFALAQLRPQTSVGSHRARLRALLTRWGTDSGALVLLNMALAKESEDLGDYPVAFQHYSAAKSAARDGRVSSAARDAAMFDAVRACFPDVEDDLNVGYPTTAPIFIIGMPRSGTTLLDRMLSNHPEVYSAGELQNFGTVLQRASGSGTALIAQSDLASVTVHIDWWQLGRAYVDSTRPVTSGKPHFTDKLPHNFLYAGFMARSLPNAKLICIRRNALDTCLANFRHLFEWQSGFYDYSLDLLDAGRYFVQFDRLMAHWRRVLPSRILEVSYESLVHETEATLRTVLAFCNLRWDPACLAPETNVLPVRTPHSWQLRAPIYVDAVGRWRHYSKEVQPLCALLQAAGIQL